MFGLEAISAAFSSASRAGVERSHHRTYVRVWQPTFGDSGDTLGGGVPAQICVSAGQSETGTVGTAGTLLVRLGSCQVTGGD
jgi:hypothetical protein